MEGESINDVKRQMDITMETLRNRRSLLREQLDNYLTYRSYVDSIDQEKLMVLIGDGYFVEKTKSEAKKFLDKRINNLNRIMEEFNGKIEGAETLLSQFEGGDDTENSEGLPYMDIVEELDEEGNVIDVKINNESRGEGERSQDQIQDQKHQDQQLKDQQLKDQQLKDQQLKDQKHNKHNSPRFLREDIEEPKSQIEELKNEYTEELNKSKTQDPNSKTKDPKDTSQDQDQDQMGELLEDMELKPRVNTDELLEKLDSLKVSSEDKFKIKEIFLKELKEIPSTQEQEPKISEIDTNHGIEEDTEPNNPAQDHIMIQNKDLLELELLADNFDDGNIDEDEDYDENEDEDEEYDFDFDSEEDGDEYEQNFFKGNNKVNDLLYNQINRMREKKLDLNGSKSNKSVKFAEELQVYEIDKEEEKQEDEPKRVSRFKMNKARPEPVSDIVEKESPVSDIVEKESPVSDIVEKESPVSDIMEKEPPVSDIMEKEPPVSDIMEKEPPVSDIMEKEPPVSDIMEKQPPISDIIEKGPPSNTTESPVSDNSDLQAMMQAYNQGDDTDITGPIINNLREFEEINKMDLNVDKFEIEEEEEEEEHGHDHDHSNNHNHNHNHNQKSKNDEILGDITENPESYPIETPQNDNLNNEIVKDYIKLKGKFSNYEGQETPTGPKTSKFKRQLRQ